MSVPLEDYQKMRDSLWAECLKLEAQVTHLRSVVSGLRKHVEELRAALKPFANRVYNDNGDVTDEYWAAYCAMKRTAPER